MAMHNPPHPGEFIKETYIEPLNISLRTAAFKLNVSPSTFSILILLIKFTNIQLFYYFGCRRTPQY